MKKSFHQVAAKRQLNNEKAKIIERVNETSFFIFLDEKKKYILTILWLLGNNIFKFVH
jgi:hypothetical protein